MHYFCIFYPQFFLHRVLIKSFLTWDPSGQVMLRLLSTQFPKASSSTPQALMSQQGSASEQPLNSQEAKTDVMINVSYSPVPLTSSKVYCRWCRTSRSGAPRTRPRSGWSSCRSWRRPPRRRRWRGPPARETLVRRRPCLLLDFSAVNSFER